MEYCPTGRRRLCTSPHSSVDGHESWARWLQDRRKHVNRFILSINVQCVYPSSIHVYSLFQLSLNAAVRCQCPELKWLGCKTQDVSVLEHGKWHPVQTMVKISPLLSCSTRVINATALFMAVISKIAAPTCHIMGLKARASKYMEVSDIYFNPVILRTMFSKPHPHPVILPKERNQNRAVAKQEWCLHLQKSGEFIRNFSSKPTTPLSIPPSK